MSSFQQTIEMFKTEDQLPHAFLITLKGAEDATVQAQQQRLTACGFHVVLVEGVKGAELAAADYFKLTRFWFGKSGKLLTPGELGCAMSHEKALRLAATLKRGRHLILEDDFIATDAALRWIASVQRHIEPGTLLHLGGQEHLPRFYRYIRGQPMGNELSGVSRVDTADLEYLQCTVAYMLHSATAQALHQLMAAGHYVADDFRYAAQQGAIQQVWFRWVVSHPTDREISTIEGERRLLGHHTKRHWSYRSRMNWARLWRHLVSPSSAFLKNQQPGNQLPT